MKGESIGLLLVGCGRISAAHLSAVAELDPAFRLVATVDPDLTAAQSAAGPFGASAFADMADALDQPGIDAVLIASPNGMHFEQAKAAIEAGKHVLVEKPLAETGAQAWGSIHGATSTQEAQRDAMDICANVAAQRTINLPCSILFIENRQQPLGW